MNITCSIKERVILMRSALVSVHGLKNELYSSAAPLFWFIDIIRTIGTSGRPESLRTQPDL